MNYFRVPFVCILSGLFVASVANALAAESFGDITVSHQPLVSGATHHGYREFRFLLENTSSKETHRVTLVLPDQAFGSGNSITRMSRTVSLGPATRAIVSLWQPPLPQTGNGLLRVEIDGGDPETMNMGTSFQHGNWPRYSGTSLPTAILVSRSLNYDDLGKAFNVERDVLGANQATGVNDSGGRRGMVAFAWMPDSAAPGPHWIELDYSAPVPVDFVRIYETMGLPAGGEILLTGVSGTNLARIPIAGRTGSGPASMLQRYSIPLTAEAVKTVRLNFGSTYASLISIDAVEIGSAGGSNAWATSALASSEASTTGTAVSAMRGVDSRELVRSEAPVSDWSEYWLSYTPYDGIAISAGDVKSMPPAVLNTLWRYTESGGNLFIFGNADVPNSWRLSSKSFTDNTRAYLAGFGECYVLPIERATELNSTVSKAMMDSARASSRIWEGTPDENNANTMFPVISNVQIPVRGIVFMMLAFVVLIGPVNLIVLTRMNRRTWLLWTVPAISIATSLLVFVYSLFREGVTPDVRIESLTLLDQVNRRATSVGTTAFYCPLTPGQGLFFGPDTEATPLVEGWDYRRTGTSRELDWTEGQHLQRGWVLARVPAHFYLRKSETRRERLQLEGKDDQLTVVNGMGATIRNLWLADNIGRIYTASNVVAGAKMKLTLGAERVSDQKDARSLFERFGFTPPTQWAESDTLGYLRRNTYIAELETNPFVENGLGAQGKKARTHSFAVVYGILDREEDTRP